MEAGDTGPSASSWRCCQGDWELDHRALVLLCLAECDVEWGATERSSQPVLCLWWMRIRLHIRLAPTTFFCSLTRSPACTPACPPARLPARTPECLNTRTPERQNARTPERQNARTPTYPSAPCNTDIGYCICHIFYMFRYLWAV